MPDLISVAQAVAPIFRSILRPSSDSSKPLWRKLEKTEANLNSAFDKLLCLLSSKRYMSLHHGIDSTPIRGPHNGPVIRERPKQTKIGKSPAGNQSHVNALSIHMIPDSVLLQIFDLCLVEDDCSSESSDAEDIPPLSGWQLAHVCQKWRYLVFASPSRFDLELVCTPRAPIRKKLGSWQTIPIVIDYREVASKDKGDIIAALQYRDRVRRITLSGLTRKLWEKLDAAMRESFPSLTRLSLTGPGDQDEHAPVLPHKLMGEGTLRLRELYLRGMSYPGLPQFLLSARDLVKLDFVQIPSTSYVSPGEMLAGLSGLTRLESLAIEFQPSILLNLLTDDRLAATPTKPAVRLPALKMFRFNGFCEYLEGLVAQIDAPLVTTFKIYYFGQPVYRVPRLAQFFVRTKYLKALSYLQIRCIPWIHLWFGGADEGSLMFQIETSGMVRGVLHSVQVMQQISAVISNIPRLCLIGPAPASTEPPFGGSLYGSTRFAKRLLPQGSLFTMGVHGVTPREEQPGVPDSIDHIDWIGLFRPFTGVEELVIRGADLSESIVHALEKVSEDMVAKVLPALRSLVFARERPTVSVNQFVSVRQKAGRPVTVLYPDDDDDEEEDHENDDDEDDDIEDEADEV